MTAFSYDLRPRETGNWVGGLGGPVCQVGYGLLVGPRHRLATAGRLAATVLVDRLRRQQLPRLPCRQAGTLQVSGGPCDHERRPLDIGSATSR